MTCPIELHDALGSAVIIGNKYGYSTREGGWSKTTIGIATKLNSSGKVSLTECVVTKYLYGKQSDYNPHGDRASVTSHHLFPVHQ